MFERLALSAARAAAARFPVVAIIGARQVGKTTLAHTAFPDYVYRDLEDPRTAERLLDEAQVVPEVLAALRGAVDARRAVNGRFVVLGSAQPALVRGVAESLAGRAAVVDLDPLCAGEAATGSQRLPWHDVWLKGGLPDALRGDFRSWWEAYLRLVLERDLPHYGVRADPLFVRRL